MKKIFSNTAFTLVELIVSLLLVSIIMMGIISINLVLSSNGQDYGQRYLVKSEAQTTLNHILNNASLAIGSSLANDEGILAGAAQVGDANTICIHQPGGAGNNLINNAADIWLCYSWTNTVPLPYQINWCAETYTGPSADPRGASSCSTSGSIIKGPTFLGSAFSMTFPTPAFSAANGFSATIQNCLNNAAATCAGGTDPANNPEVSVTGNVYPSQVSTG